MAEFKGLSLFDDIADVELRDRNRAVVMANLIEFSINRDGNFKKTDANLLTGYFNEIPEQERSTVWGLLLKTLKSRGIEWVEA